MPHYIFQPYPKGNASQKLVVFIEGQNSPIASPYSFDGRFHQNGSMRTFDDPQYWNAANGKRHLENVFANQYADDPRLRKAFRCEANYPQSGRILAAWNLQTKRWEDPEAVRAAENTAYTQKRAAIAAAQSYTFWLSVPMLTEFGKAVRWKQFYTNIANEGRALMDLIQQFDVWKSDTKNARPQSIAQIYGKEGEKYDFGSGKPPKLGWLNTTTLIPYEHRTPANQKLSVIKSYAEIQKNQQEFEEFLSNHLA